MPPPALNATNISVDLAVAVLGFRLGTTFVVSTFAWVDLGAFDGLEVVEGLRVGRGLCLMVTACVGLGAFVGLGEVVGLRVGRGLYLMVTACVTDFDETYRNLVYKV